MSEIAKVAVVLARCCITKNNWGIRLQKSKPGRWVMTGAFPAGNISSERRALPVNQIRGNFEAGPTFTGCSRCGASSLFKCACSQLACWNGRARTVTCPWCNVTSEVSDLPFRSLSAGGDA